MITIHNLTKIFKLYQRPTDRLLDMLHLGGPRYQEFFALKDINLSIPKGRTVGIVGQNGAGKSTLLKLITGTLMPTEGVIEINGRVAALLELGTGFHHEFTGRQNIYVNGQLLGLTVEELQSLEQQIVDFSELGPFIDQPIRTYSSGMILRLGFSIAAAVDPDLLIVDEALSVGDARFSQKCIRRIREFREAGTTILFVSHDPGAVTTLCDEAILLEKGELLARDLPKEILEEYNALLAAKGAGNVAMKITRRRGEEAAGQPRRHGTFQAVITEVELCNSDGVPSEVYYPEEELILRVRVDFLTPVERPTLGFLIKDRLGLEVFGSNTTLMEVDTGTYEAGQAMVIEIRVPLNIGYGDYSLTVAVHSDETHLEDCYEWTDNAALFRVRLREKTPWYGVAALHPSFRVTKAETPVEELEAALAARFDDLGGTLAPDGPPPSPFLLGFSHALTDEGLAEEGPFRCLAGHGRFVLRAAGESLALRVRPERPARLALAAHGEELARWEVTRPGTYAGRLPEGLIGRLAIFDLTATPTDGEETPSLRIHGIATTADSPEDQPEWPIMMSSS